VSAAEPTRLRVAVALATVYVVWGSTYLAIKIGLDELPPLLLAGVRFTLAGIPMYVWAARRHRRATGERLRPTRIEWRVAVIAGALLLVGGNGAVTVAEQSIDSGLAALLVASVPLWMALLDRVVFGRRLSTPAVVGLALGFIGVALLVRPDGNGQLLASLLVLGGALAWAWGSLYSRGAALPADPIASTAMQMLGGAGLFLILSAASGEFTDVDLAGVGWQSVAAVSYLAVFGSVIGFTAYTWLLRAVPASTASTYAYVNPVVAVFLGWLVLGEQLEAMALVAAALVVASVVLIVATRGRTVQPAMRGMRLRSVTDPSRGEVSNTSRNTTWRSETSADAVNEKSPTQPVPHEAVVLPSSRTAPSTSTTR
jgi:drug/metabolite transporter (DMT)-like permease